MVPLLQPGAWKVPDSIWSSDNNVSCTLSLHQKTLGGLFCFRIDIFVKDKVFPDNLPEIDQVTKYCGEEMLVAVVVPETAPAEFVVIFNRYLHSWLIGSLGCPRMPIHEPVTEAALDDTAGASDGIYAVCAEPLVGTDEHNNMEKHQAIRRRASGSLIIAGELVGRPMLLGALWIAPHFKKNMPLRTAVWNVPVKYSIHPPKICA